MPSYKSSSLKNSCCFSLMLHLHLRILAVFSLFFFFLWSFLVFHPVPCLSDDTLLLEHLFLVLRFAADQFQSKPYSSECSNSGGRSVMRRVAFCGCCPFKSTYVHCSRKSEVRGDKDIVSFYLTGWNMFAKSLESGLILIEFYFVILAVIVLVPPLPPPQSQIGGFILLSSDFLLWSNKTG